MRRMNSMASSGLTEERILSTRAPRPASGPPAIKMAGMEPRTRILSANFKWVIRKPRRRFIEFLAFAFRFERHRLYLRFAGSCLRVRKNLAEIRRGLAFWRITVFACVVIE